MKPYGHKRKDAKDTDCPCCTTQRHKLRNCRKVADKQRRKTARQQPISAPEGE